MRAVGGLPLPGDASGRAEDLRNVAEQQAALRRIATLVAQGAEPEVLFGAIATEAARLLGVGAISLLEWNPASRVFTRIAVTHNARAAFPSSSQVAAADSPLGTMIVDSGQPGRIDDWTHLEGAIARRHREEGYGQAIGAPIVVNGAVWGYIGAFASKPDGETLPPGCEDRLAEFTSLMAMAIANVQARDQLRDLAESQGALRRVATLVAQGAEPRAVFTAVATEAAGLLGVGAVSLIKWDPATQLLTKLYGTPGDRAAMPDGGQWTLAEGPQSALVITTGRPVRLDEWSDLPGDIPGRHVARGFGQSVGAPIVVDGELWGLLSAFAEAGEVLPPGSEDRLAEFTNLMAMAIANAQVRDELRALAEQQGAALRRVATLVGRQESPGVIFSAVAREASSALRVPRVDVVRCNPDGSLTSLGSTSSATPPNDPGFLGRAGRIAGEVIRAGRAVRIDDGETSDVAAPITVDGTTWGVIIVPGEEVLAADTATRLTDFTHLVASSISNVAARDKLIASRARIVSASDETRRRIERNLHDGVQQRILAIALDLRSVRTQYPLPPGARLELEDVTRNLEAVLEEIRIFSKGLHPALLARAGLGPSLRELARRSPVTVDLNVNVAGRFPQPIEIAVYYAVSETLANAAKHSEASLVTVHLSTGPAAASVRVSDNGVGGASLAGGSGLIGLVDRVEALGGRLTVDSPPGEGTTISIELPLASQTINGS
jgi:signal transduction histidine kinase